MPQITVERPRNYKQEAEWQARGARIRAILFAATVVFLSVLAVAFQGGLI